MSRFRIVAAWLVSVLLSALATSAWAEARIPEQRMSVRLDPTVRSLEGEMQVVWPEGDTTFRLLRDLEVVEASLDGEAVEVERLGGERYRISIPAGSGPLTLVWSGTLPSPESIESPVLLERESGFLPARSGWYPVPSREREVSLSLDVWMPSRYRAVATGSLSGETQAAANGHLSRYVHPRTTEVSLAFGPWSERVREVDGVTVRTLFPPALDERYADTYLEHAAAYLRMFVERMGPYPYDSFTVAASSAPVGLAFPGFTLLGERVIPLPFIPFTSLAHELAHAWWGAGVRVDYAGGNWAEALTNYMADYALDEWRGEGEETRRRWLLDLAAIPPAQEMLLTDFRSGSRGVNRLVGYLHGAMVFHMLERKIGSEAFGAGVRLFGERHMFRVAGWDDLQAAFSEAAGEDLSGFFSHWTARAGRPLLELVEAERHRDEQGGWLVSFTLEQRGGEAPWPLEVPLVIDTSLGPVSREVTLDESRQTFEIGVETRPEALNVDPGFHLLRQLHEPPPTLRAIKLDPRTRLVATRPGIENAGRNILERNPEPAESFSPGEPLLVVGGTEDVAGWLRSQGVTPPPRSMIRQGHARMWTLPGTRLAAVSADDNRGLVDIVGSLRHHYHRSYLVQDADGNVERAGTWEFDEPALRATFDSGAESRR